MSKKTLQSSSQSCPREIKDAFFKSFSSKMCVFVACSDSCRGKNPFLVAVICSKLGNNNVGPLLSLSIFCRTFLSDCLKQWEDAPLSALAIIKSETIFWGGFTELILHKLEGKCFLLVFFNSVPVYQPGQFLVDPPCLLSKEAASLCPGAFDLHSDPLCAHAP